MNLTRYNPISDLTSDAGRHFAPFFGHQPIEDWFDRFFEGTMGGAEFHGDFLENDDCYEMRFDLPGFPKESIQLSLEGEHLEIKAAVGDEDDRSRRTFRQVITLPERVDREAISAQAANGILSVRLPKAEAHKPRSITVE